jgi:hypothetical protein
MKKENEEGWRQDAIIKEQFKSGTGAHLCIQYQYFTSNVTIMYVGSAKKRIRPTAIFSDLQNIYIILMPLRFMLLMKQCIREINWD